MSQQHDLHSKLLIAFTINEPKTQFLRVLSISNFCEKNEFFHISIMSTNFKLLFFFENLSKDVWLVKK